MSGNAVYDSIINWLQEKEYCDAGTLDANDNNATFNSYKYGQFRITNTRYTDTYTSCKVVYIDDDNSQRIDYVNSLSDFRSFYFECLC